MATTARRWTYRDLDAIPQEREGDRQELIDGDLVVTPSPAPEHQIVSVNIGYFLGSYVRENNLGKVLYAPVDLRLTSHNVVIPDIVFIARDRLHIVGARTIDGVPDLVVEILSPGTRNRDLVTKRDLYARFGVQEYWIVDPDVRSLSILALRGDRFQPVPRREHNLPVSRLFPDLVIDQADIFP